MHSALARQKVLAAILALGSGGALAWLSLVVALGISISAQHPDPSAVDGDPCCPVPDTWGDVIAWSAITFGLALLASALLYLCIGCVRFMSTSRWPSASLFKIPVVVMAITTTAMLGLTAIR